MINPLAPPWSVYLSAIESNISPMINLFQYIEMNISISPLIGLWKFLNMLHTYDFSNIYAFEYPPYGLSISPLWLYQTQMKSIALLWLVCVKPIEMISPLKSSRNLEKTKNKQPQKFKDNNLMGDKSDGFVFLCFLKVFLVVDHK